MPVSINQILNRKLTPNLLIITCKIVSKLKVSPFQRVNSPLDAPVTRRRPSGVHKTQNMGHLILLVEVRTNLVVILLAGLSFSAIGGNI